MENDGCPSKQQQQQQQQQQLCDEKRGLFSCHCLLDICASFSFLFSSRDVMIVNVHTY